MKKSLLILSALVIGLTASVAAGYSSSKLESARAFGPGDEYAKTSDHFVACFNRNNALRDANYWMKQKKFQQI